jgi:hypothetical protein
VIPNSIRPLRSAVLLTLAGVLAACGGESRPTGFPIWRLRAGMPFADLEQRAWLEQRRKFECRPIVGRHRLCEVASAGLPTTGIPGTVHALVDTAGVVAAVQFRAKIDTTKMVVQSRRILDDWRRDVETLTAVWDSIARRVDLSGPGDREYWRTRDARASAWVIHDPIWGHTAAATVADERALAGVRASADLASPVLRRAGFSPEPEDLLVGMTGGPPLVLGPALPRRALAVCPPQFHMHRVADSAAADRSARVRVLERAVPLAYPGATLTVGHELSLVRDGIPERLIAESSRDSEHGLVVYAMQLPDRAQMAVVRDTPGRAAACRAPMELLLVKVDTLDAPAETYRLSLDDEATFVRVEALEIDDGGEGDPVVGVRYVATYDAPEWRADIYWEATVNVRDPRVAKRTAVAVEKRVKGTTEKRAALLSARRAGADSLRVSFLEPTPATKTVVLAHRAGTPFDIHELLARY